MKRLQSFDPLRFVHDFFSVGVTASQVHSPYGIQSFDPRRFLHHYSCPRAIYMGVTAIPFTFAHLPAAGTPLLYFFLSTCAILGNKIRNLS